MFAVLQSLRRDTGAHVLEIEALHTKVRPIAVQLSPVDIGPHDRLCHLQRYNIAQSATTLLESAVAAILGSTDALSGGLCCGCGACASAFSSVVPNQPNTD